MIHYIVQNRPYAKVEDLLRVPSITRMGFLILKNKLCCIPVVKEKVPKRRGKLNINTATVEEMEEVAGIPQWLGRFIRAHRNKHGDFESVEDLLAVGRFTQYQYDRFASKLEV